MTVDDETTPDDVIEALGHMNEEAKKCQYVVGNDTWTSPWDKAHGHINDLLDHLDRLRVDEHGGEYEQTLLELID